MLQKKCCRQARLGTVAGKVLAGAAAGAAGTTALNLVTDLDMSVRGRPASEMPARTAAKLADEASISLGDGSARENRSSGLGAVLGLVTGIGVGAIYGLVVRNRPPASVVAGVGLAVGAMAMSDLPMTALGLTDPRTWKAADWASDAVPHLAFGLVTAVVYRRLLRRASTG